MTSSSSGPERGAAVRRRGGRSVRARNTVINEEQCARASRLRRLRRGATLHIHVHVDTISSVFLYVYRDVAESNEARQGPQHLQEDHSEPGDRTDSRGS